MLIITVTLFASKAAALPECSTQQIYKLIYNKIRTLIPFQSI